LGISKPFQLADHVVTLAVEPTEKQSAFRGVVNWHGIRLGEG
jgi:hypothetical protein